MQSREVHPSEPEEFNAHTLEPYAIGLARSGLGLFAAQCRVKFKLYRIDHPAGLTHPSRGRLAANRKTSLTSNVRSRSMSPGSWPCFWNGRRRLLSSAGQVRQSGRQADVFHAGRVQDVPTRHYRTQTGRVVTDRVILLTGESKVSDDVRFQLQLRVKRPP